MNNQQMHLEDIKGDPPIAVKINTHNVGVKIATDAIILPILAVGGKSSDVLLILENTVFSVILSVVNSNEWDKVLDIMHASLKTSLKERVGGVLEQGSKNN